MAKGACPIMPTHQARGVHPRIHNLKNEEAKFTNMAMGKLLAKRKHNTGPVNRTRKMSKLGSVVHTCVAAKPIADNTKIEQQSADTQAVGVYDDCISAAVTPMPVNPFSVPPKNRRILQLQKFEEEFVAKEGSRVNIKPVVQSPVVRDKKQQPLGRKVPKRTKPKGSLKKKNKENSNPEMPMKGKTPMKLAKKMGGFTPKKMSKTSTSWKVLSSAKKMRTTKSLHNIDRGITPMAIPVFIDQL